MATTPRDFYEVLGRLQVGFAGRDQEEGLPGAGPQVASGSQPGRRGAEERFKEIQQAYDALSDPKKRKEYDSRGPLRRVPPAAACPVALVPAASPAAASPRISVTSSPPSSGAGASRDRASSEAGTSRPRFAYSSTRRGYARDADRGLGSHHGALSDLRGQWGQARHLSSNLPPLRGVGNQRPEPGALLDLAALPRMRWSGPWLIDDPCPTCAGQGNHPGDQAVPGEHPRRSS